MAVGVRNNAIDEIEDDEADFEYLSPSQFFSSNINLIPLQNAVQGPRLFYGARFINQALPLQHGETPWVANLDPLDKDGRSYDEIFGGRAGAVFADEDGEVEDANDDGITVRYASGTSKHIPLYRTTPYNRKSGIHQTPLVKKGDIITPKQLLARSNYTDDKGRLAMGVNARIGLTAHRAYGIDDAVEVSESFAKKLTSDHMETYDQEWDDQTKGGREHFTSLFPKKYTVEQLEKMDDAGFVKPGTILNPGDPISLATSPRSLSSATAAMGGLSRSVRMARRDASQIWDAAVPGEVTDVVDTKHGKRAVIRSYRPAQRGDKMVLRSGNKGTISRVIPDDRMPRTEDNQPLEVLLNHLGLVSRANDSLPFELLVGKLAAARGEPIKMPGFNKPEESLVDQVEAMLAEAGVSPEEKIFDPESNKWLKKPITVGSGYVMKLHHTSECYDDQTEVLTQDGWKNWADVTKDDELATSDERGQELRFEKPLHVFSYDYRGNLCTFAGRYLDYAVTPNHNMWQKPYYGQRTYSFCQASQLHGTRFKVKQFGLVPTCPGGPDTFELGGKIFDWDDFCEFTGWWVTEGCVNSGKTGVLVYQSSTANPEKCARIEELICRMGVNWSPYIAEGIPMGFAVNEKAFAEFFGQHGSHSQFKSVPRQLMLGRLSGCRRMLAAMILGDGTTQKTATGPSTRFTTTSEQLANDFQELCVRLGEGSIIRKEPRDWKKYQDNPHYLDAWNCSWTGSRNHSQVDGDRGGEGFEIRPYTGKVYCAEMCSGLLYVRRNGKPMLCGNSKSSSRGQGSYDNNQQPSKGGGESAQAKRLSGLESHALLSSGAYATLREGATLRGQQNDAYWRSLRQGQTPKPPGQPFVWDKFLALLAGTGMRAKDLGDGRMRLGPFTDRDLEKETPIEVRNSGLLDLKTLEPKAGGLFDPALSAANKWGSITLPKPLPNPAFHDSIRQLFGLTKNEFEAVLAGEAELPAHLLE